MQLKNEFEQIDKRLVERTSSEDVDENMKIASELYDQDLTELEEYVVYPPLKILQAEKMFLSLKKLSHQRSCKFAGLNILRENRDAILINQLDNHEKEKINVGSRIVKVFSAILKQHAQLCRDIWLDRVEKLLKNYDPEILNYVSNLTGGLFFDHLERDTRIQYVAAKSAATDHYTYSPEYTYDALELILIGKPDDKFIRPLENETCGHTTIDEVEFKRIYNDYLVRSCRHYIGTFRSVFEMADIEADFIEPDSRYGLFFLAWSWYRLCSDFMEQQEALFGKLISYAHTRRCRI